MRKHHILRAGHVLLLAALLLAGCAPSAMKSADIDPPTRGLIHYLQQSGMVNVSDHGYRVVLLNPADVTGSGEERVLRFQVLQPSDVAAETFQEDMTKLMHMIVVSRDLSYFAHVHPEYQGNGEFSVRFRFPLGGDYLLIHEFMPDNAGLTVSRQWVRADGDRKPDEALAVSASPVRTVEGIQAEISLIPGPQEIKAGQMAMIGFHLTDADTGEELALEPYLGTSGHAVVLSDAADRYLHVHAEPSMSQGSFVMFHTSFPAPGLYKIWGQFQYRGRVLTFPFVVQIN